MTISEKYYTIMSINDLTFLDERCNETDTVDSALCIKELSDAKHFLTTLDTPEDFFVAELIMTCEIKRV